MTKCDFCDVEEDLPFVCNYCEKTFCAEHRLPESHSCQRLWMAKMRRRPSVFQDRTPERMLRGGYNLKVPTEAKHLVIAWLVLGFSFSSRYLLRNSALFSLMFVISLATVGLGFILHELAHKFSAKRYGCLAEFRIWPWGLAMTLIFAVVSAGSFVFAAPGATYVAPSRRGYFFNLTRRPEGIISIVGPIVNVILAVLFLFASGMGGALTIIGRTGYQVNLWLAAFNMIPLGGLDGQKVLTWSIPVWAAFSIPLWLVVALQFFF